MDDFQIRHDSRVVASRRDYIRGIGRTSRETSHGEMCRRCVLVRSLFLQMQLTGGQMQFPHGQSQTYWRAVAIAAWEIASYWRAGGISAWADTISGWVNATYWRAGAISGRADAISLRAGAISMCTEGFPGGSGESCRDLYSYSPIFERREGVCFSSRGWQHHLRTDTGEDNRSNSDRWRDLFGCEKFLSSDLHDFPPTCIVRRFLPAPS
jgi:hypothetical protein